MSRYCKACNLKESLKKSDPDSYTIWKESHSCKLNYRGSAPAMEVTGAERIFGRSIAKYKLRYRITSNKRPTSGKRLPRINAPLFSHIIL